MAKKSKDPNQAPTIAFVPSRDVHNRLNFLYQASTLLSIALGSTGAPRNATTKNKGKGKEIMKDFLIPTQIESIVEDQEHMEVDEAEITSFLETREQNDQLPTPSTSKLPSNPPSNSTETLPSPPAVLAEPEVWMGDVATAIASNREELKLVKRKVPRKAKSSIPEVVQMMTKTMKEIAKRSTLRMDPSVKRTLCKKCSSLLIPGLTCRVRVKPSKCHAHLLIYTCDTCQKQLRLPAPPHLPEPNETVENSTSKEGPELEGVEYEQVDPVRKLSKREKREEKQKRKPVLFERKGHVDDTKPL